jgi:hypothetical protein
LFLSIADVESVLNIITAHCFKAIYSFSCNFGQKKINEKGRDRWVMFLSQSKYLSSFYYQLKFKLNNNSWKVEKCKQVDEPLKPKLVCGVSFLKSSVYCDATRVEKAMECCSPWTSQKTTRYAKENIEFISV